MDPDKYPWEVAEHGAQGAGWPVTAIKRVHNHGEMLRAWTGRPEPPRRTVIRYVHRLASGRSTVIFDMTPFIFLLFSTNN